MRKFKTLTFELRYIIVIFEEMMWKYFIPGELEGDSRSCMEDIYLLAEDNSESVWLSVTAMGFFYEDEFYTVEPELYKKVKAGLADAQSFVEGTDVYLKQMDFNRKELLNYAFLWLKGKGFKISMFAEGEPEEFRKTNQAIDAFESSVEKMMSFYSQNN